MNDLISRSALIESHTWLWDSALGHCECVLVEDIKAAPAVDAVEVVRCKDCKHLGKAIRAFANKEPIEIHACTIGGYPNLSLDHFCSYGERRNSDATG